MKYRVGIMVLVAVLYTPAHVTGVTMIIQDTSLVEGQTLQITCQEKSLVTDSLYSLMLQRLDTSGIYQTVVRYDLKQGKYEPTWGSGSTGWQSRANITGNFNTDQTGGSFVFRLGSVLYNDSSTFRCFVSTSLVPNPDPSPPQNVTIHVTGVTMTISATSLVEGQTLQITCRQESLVTESLYSLRLQRLDTSGKYQTVVRYVLKAGKYERLWGSTGWQARANITGHFNTDQTGGSFVLKLGHVLCNDASTFRCSVVTSREPDLAPTPSQNVTIRGVTHNLRVDGPPICTSSLDPDCQQCKNFDDPNGETPGYAEMEKPVNITCGAEFATPITMNTVTWYKRVLNQQQNEVITENITQLQYDPPTGNRCRIQATSTLTYYPQPTDRELRILCQVNIQGEAGNPTITAEISICVQGLIA